MPNFSVPGPYMITDKYPKGSIITVISLPQSKTLSDWLVEELDELGVEYLVEEDHVTGLQVRAYHNDPSIADNEPIPEGIPQFIAVVVWEDPREHGKLVHSLTQTGSTPRPYRALTALDQDAWQSAILGFHAEVENPCSIISPENIREVLTTFLAMEPEQSLDKLYKLDNSQLYRLFASLHFEAPKVESFTKRRQREENV